MASIATVKAIAPEQSVKLKLMEEIKRAVADTVKDLWDVEIEPELTRPSEQFGDYSTNVALQLAGKAGKTPREIAEALKDKISSPKIEKIDIAGPGFLNITLTDDALIEALHKKPAQPYKGKTVVAEYSDPNPFKELHVGHLYTSVVGDAVAKLYEAAGANVHRVNFGGDVGLHVAKSMWAILKTLGGELPEKLSEIKPDEQASWLSQRYVEGSQAYETDEQAKREIIDINKRIYGLFGTGDKVSPFARIYFVCREWSYEYFNRFYASLGSHFEKYYPESETVARGMQAVQENIGKIFEKSDGAVVFKGEVHSLHTRVFINSAGLPTYETKDIGLALAKWDDYHFDYSLIITGNDIVEYMKVVLAALAQLSPDIAKRTIHLTHGLVKLGGGGKMSSRTGRMIRAQDVLDAVRTEVGRTHKTDSWDTVLGAVKYAFLKHRIGGDLVFDIAESVNLEGNSGPYLQYAHARACSILGKVQKSLTSNYQISNLDEAERSLLRKITEYAEVVDRAVNELMPHYICTYLYELAQKFNSFYEKNRIIGDSRQAVRLQLIQAYANSLKNGLELLNIPAPERI